MLEMKQITWRRLAFVCGDHSCDDVSEKLRNIQFGNDIEVICRKMKLR